MIENSGGFRHYWWGADLDCSGAQCPLSAGNWYHVASTWDGTTRKLYLNGVLKRSDTPGANNATAANFHIGKTCCSEYFNGLIDDVAIFSRALTQAEVTELADGTAPTTTTTSTTTTTTTTSTTTTTTTTVPAGVRTPGTSTTSTTTTVPANAGGTVAPPVPKVQVVQSGEAGVRMVTLWRRPSWSGSTTSWSCLPAR